MQMILKVHWISEFSSKSLLRIAFLSRICLFLPPPPPLFFSLSIYLSVSLSSFLVTAEGCDGLFEDDGIVTRQLRPVDLDPAADIVIIVDESRSMVEEHQWIPSMVQQLDEKLRGVDIGNGARPNRFALLGFGRDYQEAGSTVIKPYFEHYKASNGDPMYGVAECARLASRLALDGYIEDGYLAIEYAIKNLTYPDGRQALRSGIGIARNIILITDEDRDTFAGAGEHLNRKEVKKLLRKNNFVLNVVVDHQFYDLSGNKAMGVARGVEQDEFFVTQQGQGDFYAISRGGHMRHPYRTTKKDFTSLAMDIHIMGAAWDINYLSEGGTLPSAFTNAFIHVKEDEIKRQVHDCYECRCDGIQGERVCRHAANQPFCCTEAGGTVSQIDTVENYAAGVVQLLTIAKWRYMKWCLTSWGELVTNGRSMLMTRWHKIFFVTEWQLLPSIELNVTGCNYIWLTVNPFFFLFAVQYRNQSLREASDTFVTADWVVWRRKPPERLSFFIPA